jgi:hypothetical protein
MQSSEEKALCYTTPEIVKDGSSQGKEATTPQRSAVLGIL